MGFQKQNISFFLNNAVSHPRPLNPKKLKKYFSTPTSVCQFVNQFLKQNFKFFLLWFRFSRQQFFQRTKACFDPINPCKIIMNGYTYMYILFSKRRLWPISYLTFILKKYLTVSKHLKITIYFFLVEVNWILTLNDLKSVSSLDWELFLAVFKRSDNRHENYL